MTAVEHNYDAAVLLAHKFTGKERDAESGLDNLGARYYASASGRFSATDPKIISRQRMYDPQQWNMYAYARNNPLVYLDPDGREVRTSLRGKEYDALVKTLAGCPRRAGFARLGYI
jgi:RHS repeat-associated protein